MGIVRNNATGDRSKRRSKPDNNKERLAIQKETRKGEKTYLFVLSKSQNRKEATLLTHQKGNRTNLTFNFT